MNCVCRYKQANFVTWTPRVGTNTGSTTKTKDQVNKHSRTVPKSNQRQLELLD